ncbi:hypothetical protein BDN72DRAFT_957001 [Pluteus cervinus]|uniref:Uncharacterized protein n=1 Tax=Pluteus cervinus TaxID=181527 RepID=A0ACD3B3E0_9AGAR|nr:hypothetical protein BDN72DRAFT_957001 [Pluteus cervinus]
MGQRHQAYIIARVIPYGNFKTQHRCVSALHHQWCYGSLPLKAALRFMKLIKQKEHARVILEEIKALNGKYGSHLEKTPLIPSVPCPFTSLLMKLAWSLNLDSANPEDMYLSRALDLDAFMKISEGDNNDGVTVINVSDPYSPSYSFVSSACGGGKPITAEQYVRNYYPPGSEAWPTDFRATQKDSSISESTGIMTTAPKEVPSLADLVLGPALEKSLRDNNQEELLRLLLPHIFDQILVILRSHNPMLDGGVFLLSNILEGIKDKKIINLSGFHFSSQQVLSFIPIDAELEVVDLSHNHAADIEVIEQLLTRYRSLRRLVLLDTHIPEDDIVALLKTKPELFYRIEAIVHPVFMKPLTSTPIPSACTHIFILTDHEAYSTYHPPSCVGLPFFTPAQVLRALLHYTKIIKENLAYGISLENGWTIALGAYASESLRDGRNWGERIVPYVPSLLRLPDALKSIHGWNLFWAPSWCYSEIPYAFVKDGGNGSFQVYDVRGFFKELELEGRPAVPQDELEVLFNEFAVVKKGQAVFRCFSEEEVHKHRMLTT